MSEENGSSINGALVSFLAGLAVGAVVAALVTPKSGPQTRRELAEFGRRAKDRAKEMGGKVGEVLAKTKAEAGQTLADLKRGLVEAANSTKA